MKKLECFFKPSILFLLYASILSGCGLLGSSKQPEEKQERETTSTSDLEQEPGPETSPALGNRAKQINRISPQDEGANTISTIELLWQVPGEAVEKYHIHYGSNPKSLDQEVIVPVSNLEKSDHPQFGPVFRFRLPGVSPDKKLFVSLQAENKAGVSTPSETIEVSPDKGYLSRAIN